MLKKNDEITLTIDAMTTEGSGIGRHEGIAVVVPNTAVGDTVLCHIIKAKKNYAVGKAFKDLGAICGNVLERTNQLTVCI